MNDEFESDIFQFIVHHCSFIISEIRSTKSKPCKPVN
jgi:hypothetical protein